MKHRAILNAIQLRNGRGGGQKRLHPISSTMLPASGAVERQREYAGVQRAAEPAGDSCVLDVSGDGGSSWTSVLTLHTGTADANTPSVQAASGVAVTASQRLDRRMTVNGNGLWETCFLLAGGERDLHIVQRAVTKKASDCNSCDNDLCAAIVRGVLAHMKRLLH